MNCEVRHSHNKDIIVQTAFQIFTKYGIECTTAEMIANDAHISIRTFYRHFPSRKDLVDATIIYCMSTMNNYLNRLTADDLQKEKNGLDRLLNYLYSILILSVRHCEMICCVNELEIYELRHKIPNIVLYYDESFDNFMKRFRVIIKSGISDGSIRADALDNVSKLQCISVDFRAFYRRIAIINMYEKLRIRYNTNEIIDEYLKNISLHFKRQL